MNKVVTLSQSAARKLARGAVEIGTSLAVAGRKVAAVGGQFVPAFALALGVCAVMSSSAFADTSTIPSEITDMTNNVTTVFGNVKTVILSIVGFGMLVWIVKKVRRA